MPRGSQAPVPAQARRVPRSAGGWLRRQLRAPQGTDPPSTPHLPDSQEAPAVSALARGTRLTRRCRPGLADPQHTYCVGIDFVLSTTFCSPRFIPGVQFSAGRESGAERRCRTRSRPRPGGRSRPDASGDRDRCVPTESPHRHGTQHPDGVALAKFGRRRGNRLTDPCLSTIVRSVPKYHGELDAVLRALADPTRRAVVEQLAKSPAVVSELAAPFSMALPSLMQHLRVLDSAGLVTSQKHGRARTVSLRPGALDVLHRWLDEQRTPAERQADRLGVPLSVPLGGQCGVLPTATVRDRPSRSFLEGPPRPGPASPGPQRP